MPYLRHKTIGAVTQELGEQGFSYEALVTMRDPANNANTLWEDVAEEDIIGVNTRVYVIAAPAGLAVAANGTYSSSGEVGRPATVTQVNYVAQSPGIVGQATNSRTLTIVQGTAQGAGSPARTTIATLALLAGVNAPTGQLSNNFTINSAALIADAPLELVSTAVGTGLVDPGGLALVFATLA